MKGGPQISKLERMSAIYGMIDLIKSGKAHTRWDRRLDRLVPGGPPKQELTRIRLHRSRRWFPLKPGVSANGLESHSADILRNTLKS